MDLKEFFRPTVKKIIVLLALMFIAHIAALFFTCIGSPCFVGFPLEYYRPAMCTSYVDGSQNCWPMDINFLNLAVNIVIWYFVSCLLCFSWFSFLWTIIAVLLFAFASTLPIVPAWYQFRCIGCVPWTAYHDLWYTARIGNFTFWTYFVIILEIIIPLVGSYGIVKLIFRLFKTTVQIKRYRKKSL